MNPWGCYINLYVSDSTEMIPEVVTFDLHVTVIPQEWTLRLLHWSVCQWFHRNEPWGCYIDLYVSDSTGMNPEIVTIGLYVSDFTGMNPEVFTIDLYVSDFTGMNPEVFTIDLWHHNDSSSRNESPYWHCMQSQISCSKNGFCSFSAKNLVYFPGSRVMVGVLGVTRKKCGYLRCVRVPCL